MSVRLKNYSRACEAFGIWGDYRKPNTKFSQTQIDVKLLIHSLSEMEDDQKSHSLIAGSVHPLHARQPRPGHPHHPGPSPEAQTVAVRQDPQGRLEVLLLSPVLVERRAQELLDIKFSC